jgi:hypothetical protein
MQVEKNKRLQKDPSALKQYNIYGLVISWNLSTVLVVPSIMRWCLVTTKSVRLLGYYLLRV